MSRCEPLLDSFHPLVRRWFLERFRAPSEPQVRGWPHILAGDDTLIAAPTGSGKTLAAFLACLDRLFREGERGTLPVGIDVVYVSPLKALGNDIQRNLQGPLDAIRELAMREGVALPAIGIGVRSGDTSASERAKMARRPPHILITTPESLYIMLTAERSRAALAGVRTVIVDEIHALAGDKRGAHLALSLERLDDLITAAGQPRPNRVGLSATQKPIELVGRLLVGAARPAPIIVDGGHARTLDLRLERTDDQLGAVASNEQCGRVYDRVAELVREHETTLVFVNTRRLVERVSHLLEERLGPDQVVAHHGSLSKERRFAAEQKLKSGSVRCAVATASLELGIDVGAIDLVVQIGSTRSIATFLQRIGRSGHSLGKIPKGRLFALTRDQLVEAVALMRAVGKGVLDALHLAPAPLDILAQQLVAEVAARGMATEEELFALVRRAIHYQELPRERFDEVVEMLAEGISNGRGRASAQLHRDRLAGTLKPRRGARLVAITNGGAIPDQFSYPVVTFPEETPVGTLDEDFTIDSSAGDIFLLGNTSWRICRIGSDKVWVEDAAGAPPNVPFWFGEAPARTEELSAEIGLLRAEVEDSLLAGADIPEIAAGVASAVAMDESLATELVEYLAAGRAALGAMPTHTTLIAERFTDDGGGMQLVLHSPLGGRINKAWGLALRKRFCRSFNLELQAAATDDGLVLSLGPVHSFPLETVFDFLRAASVAKVLEQAVLGAPVFGVRWRWNASRALALVRRRGGKKVPPQIQRMRSDDLLSTVFPMQQACLENVVGDIEIPGHPLVAETLRDCVSEFMDIEGLETVLRRIESGEIRVLARETAEPSPLCHELLNANPYAFLDDAPLEERRTRAISLRRSVRGDQPASDLALLDPEAVLAAETAAAAPIRDPDELHDCLLGSYTVPVAAALAAHAHALTAAGRATLLTWPEGRAWVAAERLPVVLAAVGDARCEPVLGPLPFEVEVPCREKAAALIVRGYLDRSGPRSLAELSRTLGLPASLVLAALGELEASGIVLRGRFTRAGRDAGRDEYCERTMLARCQRQTLQRLRRAIEPVDAATLNRFLFRWQRVGRGAKLIGADGLLAVIEQLQGFETAAGAWERDVFPARLYEYEPSWLDALCYEGMATWARLSGRACEPGGKSAPTRAAPLTLMRREDVLWLRAGAPLAELGEASETAGRARNHLHDRGASFLADLVAALELPAVDVENALWELVAAGLATADSFASLRLLIDRPKGEIKSPFDPLRRGQAMRSSRWRDAVSKVRRRDGTRQIHAVRSLPTSSGRWSLLGPADPSAACPESHARQLLHRYGVVFRELLARETALPPWRELSTALRRLEARGEIRGGRFVGGFGGEQFALPEAVDALRSLRRTGSDGPELVTIAATDPLNLVGITSPGPKVAAVVGNAVLYCDGVPIASLESGEVFVRATLEPGARVDGELRYHGPARLSRAASQVSLPL